MILVGVVVITIWLGRTRERWSLWTVITIGRRSRRHRESAWRIPLRLAHRRPVRVGADRQDGRREGDCEQRGDQGRDNQRRNRGGATHHVFELSPEIDQVPRPGRRHRRSGEETAWTVRVWRFETSPWSLAAAPKAAGSVPRIPVLGLECN